MRMRVHLLPEKRSSRGLKYLREEGKAPWDSSTASWAALNGHLHILEYLVERKYNKYDAWACECAAKKGHLDCLKYLHETAKAPWELLACTLRARQQPTRLCTIPPREQLSSTRWLAIRRRSVTQVVNMDTRIHKENTEREKERDKERDTLIYTTLRVTSITICVSLNSLMQKKSISQSNSLDKTTNPSSRSTRTRHILKEDNDRTTGKYEGHIQRKERIGTTS